MVRFFFLKARFFAVLILLLLQIHVSSSSEYAGTYPLTVDITGNPILISKNSFSTISASFSCDFCPAYSSIDITSTGGIISEKLLQGNAGFQRSITAKFSSSSSGTFRVTAIASGSGGSTKIYGFSGEKGVDITVINKPPGIPSKPEGQISGVTGTSYRFETSAIEPDTDRIKYTFDWGDNSNNITDFMESGATVAASHVWGSPGIYYIKVVATDSEGLNSEWSSFEAINIESSPLLSVTPDGLSFNFGSMNSGESSSKTFSISNSGGGTLTWSISNNKRWISINPTSGTNSGTITLDVKTEDLSSGSYSGNITIISNGGMKNGIVSLNILDPIKPDIIVTSEPSTILPNNTSVITVIVTGMNNQPIKGAMVRLNTEPESTGEIRYAFGSTNDKGIFTTTYNAFTEGIVTIKARVTREDLIEAKKDIKITIKSGKVAPKLTYIMGAITDAETGKAVSGVTVTAGNISIATGMDGRYELSVVPGEYNLTVAKSKYETITKSISVSEERNVIDLSMNSINSMKEPPIKLNSIIVVMLAILLPVILIYSRYKISKSSGNIVPKIEMSQINGKSVPRPTNISDTVPAQQIVVTSPPVEEITNSINIKSGHEYKCANISYKVSIENNGSETVSDIRIELNVPDVFLLKENKKTIPLLQPGESQTITFEIRPTGECGNCKVEGEIRYYDYSSRRHSKQEIQTKMVSVICPVLKRKEIDIKQWEKVTDDLIIAEESIKELSIPAENLFNITKRVIKDNGMYMLDPEISSTPQLFEGVAQFYAQGTSGLRYAAYIEVVGGTQKSRLILKAWAEKDEALTGFYHRLLDGIEKRINVKIFIDDVQKYIHNEYVSGDKIGRDQVGTQINDSFVKNSNIGAVGNKCPDCGREVEANEESCRQCEAKLQNN